jgi:hypothetical protein
LKLAEQSGSLNLAGRLCGSRVQLGFARICSLILPPALRISRTGTAVKQNPCCLSGLCLLSPLPEIVVSTPFAHDKFNFILSSQCLLDDRVDTTYLFYLYSPNSALLGRLNCVKTQCHSIPFIMPQRFTVQVCNSRPDILIFFCFKSNAVLHLMTTVVNILHSWITSRPHQHSHVDHSPCRCSTNHMNGC